MSARRRRPRLPEPDGLVAGVVIAAANVFGISAVAGATGLVSALPDTPLTTVLDDNRSVPDQRPLPTEGKPTAVAGEPPEPDGW